MKFKLKVFNYVSQKEEQWTYDNSNNLVLNSFGDDPFPDFEKKDIELIKLFDRDFNLNKKSKNNQLLEITLGLKCNFHCKYCSQTAYRDLAYSSSPKDVKPFIEKLKKSGIKCQRIQLWGGEPLVYWKVVEKLVPELRKLFPEAHISAPTNGSLLTRKIVDFMGKYNMYLYISHDGCGNNNRGKEGNGDCDVLENPVVMDAIRYAQKVLPPNHIAFGVTPSAGNTDVVKIIKFFKNKVGEDTQASTHNIVRCHNSFEPEGVKASYISPEELKIYSNSVFNVLNMGEQEGHRSMNGDYSLWRKRQNMINSIIYKYPMMSICGECVVPGPHGLIVDMLGNVLQCHNHPTINSKSGDLSNIEKVEALGYKHCSTKERCRNCLVLHSCRGGCPSADDRANELACPNLYALHWGIFRAAFLSLFGINILEYEKIYDNE